MARILMGFAEALPAAEVLFSLRAAGHQVSAFTRAGKTSPALARLLDSTLTIPAPETDVTGAVTALQAHSAGFDAVYALDDTALWLANRAFEGQDAPLPIHATGAPAVLALDKRMQVAAAAAAGLDVPQTVVADDLATIQAVDFLPAIVKPALAIQENTDGGLVKGGVHYLLTAADREALADPDVTYPALVQPLVAGIGEGVFGFVCADGSITGWSGHERVRMMNPHGSGSSACRSLAPTPALRDKITAMMTAIGWQGPFMVELLRDADGRQWFMEINGRMWGSLALGRRQGFEYPAWAVSQAHDPAFCPPPVPEPTEPIVMRHLGREIMHLIFTLKGPKSAFHKPGWPKFLTSLMGVLKPSRARYFYNYDPANPRYFLRDAWAVIRGFLRR